MTGLILAVDGNNLAHRAYYAFERRGDRTPDGRPVWAIQGFLSMLVGIIDRTDPDALVVGFDDRNGSDRQTRYPQYKTGRGERHQDLYTQLDALPGLLGELGIPVIIPDRLEADDVLASASARAEAADWRCVIATSDKDAFGLVSKNTTVLRPGAAIERVTPEVLLTEYGVTPAQWLDYTALVGDTSDNLPGVRGIGRVNAVKLLNAFRSINDALADPAGTKNVIGKAMAAKLATPTAAQIIARNIDLMTLSVDVPVDPTRCRPWGTSGQIQAALETWHLPALAHRLTAALCPRVQVRHTSATQQRVREPLDCPMCHHQIYIVQMTTGERRPVNAQPDTAGSLGWSFTPSGWRMRRLGAGDQPEDKQHRRWTAHNCAGQWTLAA